MVKSDTDALNRTTLYQYDSNRRVTRVTRPSGAYTSYTYDSRGNVTEVRQVSKTPGTPADIVTTAVYPTTCSNVVTCNKPTSVTNSAGQTTSYTYNATHGGVEWITSPGVAAGTPQLRHSYTQLSVTYSNTTQTPIWKLTGTSQCTSGGGACIGGPLEVRATIAYNSQLLPSSITTASGDGSLSATSTITYDAVGNVLTVDGPLAGDGDTTRYRYDAMRQLVGVIGPDPDGSSGTRKPQAVKITYNADGQVISRESGTVNSQNDADWASFVQLQNVATVYDGYGRKTSDALKVNNVIQALRQYSYDAVSRPECDTVRMDQTVFAALPDSACTVKTGADGYSDRVSKAVYNNADQVTKVLEADGTSGIRGGARTAMETTYNSDGSTQGVSDGLQNKTTYEYDGHGRLAKITYPTIVVDGVTSPPDFESFTYDSASRVSSYRRRNNTTVSISYDALGRVISRDGRTYTYDNLNRVTCVSSNSQMIGYTYDVLGRVLKESQPTCEIKEDSIVVASEYDLAGRRTKLIYPGTGFAVNYDYDNAGNLTAVRENAATSGEGVLASFTYDNYGRRTGMSRGNGVTSGYSYDALNRLTGLSHNPTGTDYAQSVSYEYNRGSQIVKRIASNEAYTRPIPAKVDRSFTMDQQNRIAKIGTVKFTYDANGNLTGDGKSSFGYNDDNQLTSGNGATLTYDALGRLYSVTKGVVTTRYIYDGNNLIAEFDTANKYLRRYVHGAGVDEPLVLLEGSGNSDRRWLLADERGSIMGVTDSSGVVIVVNTYTEYGEPGNANQGRFQYTGQLWIPEVGIYHYKARAYYPSLGRFLQPDPIGYGDGMNLYAYVGGDPIGRTDPSGTTETPSCGVMTVCQERNPRFISLEKWYFNIARLAAWSPPNVSSSTGGGAGSGGGVGTTDGNDESQPPSAQNVAVMPEFVVSAKLSKFGIRGIGVPNDVVGHIVERHIFGFYPGTTTVDPRASRFDIPRGAGMFDALKAEIIIPGLSTDNMMVTPRGDDFLVQSIFPRAVGTVGIGGARTSAVTFILKPSFIMGRFGFMRLSRPIQVLDHRSEVYDEYY